MALGDYALIIGTLLGLLVLFQPRLIKWAKWRATVTPLASIIGSGFLVSGPILAHASGRWAFAAMFGLCVIGYLYGSVIRHNIEYVEPYLQKNAKKGILLLERFSEFALILAYFISIAFYLNLFSAFALRSFNISDEIWIKVLTSIVLIVLGIIGYFRGLNALEKIEEYSVGFKLSVIFALILAIGVVSIVAFGNGEFSWPELNHTMGMAEIQILLGLVILVQGFETSRYLGHAYDAKTRVKTMRVAQWISTGIYVVFILLATRYFTGDLPKTGGETAIIDLLKPLGILLAPLLILAAMASQLSAAVADMNGSGGLLREASGKKFNPHWGYAISAIASLIIIWIANIYEIIAFASKAFILYYGLQSLQAVLAIINGKSKAAKWRIVVYGLGIILAILVIIFAIPAGV
ncbi:MAG: hypothetical protein L3J15_00265 [Devosiaceae bacterium]|nr:hypothetical protein [Devosiaceae bacterium]